VGSKKDTEGEREKGEMWPQTSQLIRYVNKPAVP
jgi:hypothetical protein